MAMDLFVPVWTPSPGRRGEGPLAIGEKTDLEGKAHKKIEISSIGRASFLHAEG
jgi:hypothetical protein